MGMDEGTWQRFADGLQRVVDHCRERGYEPTFHHETGTFIEAPWEVERLLEVSDIGLCLDTGHFRIGGGDPARAIKASLHPFSATKQSGPSVPHEKL